MTSLGRARSGRARVGPWNAALAAALTLGALVALPGCASNKEIGPPPAAPSVSRPVQAIPADLDVVVRIDLEPIRAVLPKSIQDELTAGALAGDPSAASDVVRRAIELTRQVWIGFRPGQEPGDTDNVLVLRGDFRAMSEAELGDAFKPPRDLGAGWRVYDVRRSQGRSSPARLYTHLDDLWVVSSVAEIDAVERVIEGGARDETVEPPERGVISVAARMQGVAASMAQRSPKAARFLSNADAAALSANLDSEGLEVFAQMTFVDEIAANRAMEATKLVIETLQEQVPEPLRGKVTVVTVDNGVTLHARVPQLVLALLLRGEVPAARATP
jgi:hypothetical protein